MVTTVGTESDLVDMLNNLIQLDYDAIDAYDAAIDRVASPEYKARLREFRDDHARHTRDVGAVVTKLGGTPARQGGAKSMMTRGKVMLADLMGDSAILQATKSNEEDTNTAYERAVKAGEGTPAAIAPLRAGLEDERRHRAWIEQALSAR
jgi:uncharacterized protein (TIGR02284 family)